MLLAHDRKIDAARIEPRRGAGFQPPDRQGQFTQTGRQRRRRRLAHASAGRLRQADVNLAVEKSPRRQHHGLCHETQPMFGHRPAHSAVFDNQIVATLREQREIRLVFKEMADRLPVMRPVGLHARGAHRRAFGGVEDAELDAGPVRGNPHRPVKRIDLAHQMPLADPANRRVAAQRPERFQIVREQQGTRANARCRQRCLGTGMAATDHNNVEGIRVLHGK